MKITFKVPSIACEVCAKTITNAVESNQTGAKVEVDVESKIVTVETEASLETIQQIIEAAGHTVESPTDGVVA